MKNWILGIVAIVVGIAGGVSLAVLDYAQPGADFERITTGKIITRLPTRDVAGPHPQLHVADGPEFDFGVMDRGETRSHVFRVDNNGNAPLKLQIGETTCKCAVGELSSDTIPPGESGDVVLEWTAKSYEPDFRQSATIHTNDPVYPALVLSIAGRVRQLVRAVPVNVRMSGVPARASRTAQTVVYGYVDDELNVVSYDWSDEDTAEFFDFRWEPASAEVLAAAPDAKAAFVGFITIKPGLPIGPALQTLRITTSSSRSSLVELAISAHIVTDISVMGAGYNDQKQMLKLGPVQRGEGIHRTLRVTVKGPYRNTVKLSVGQLEPPGVMQVSISKPRPLNSGAVYLYLLDVSIPPDAPAVNCLGGEGRPHGKIPLLTTHPEAGEIPIAVSFAVMD